MQQKRYDVVIVGAGSAGCVLAARLSEDPARQVLLLEAGRDFPTIASRPAVLKRDPWNGVADPAFLWRYDGVATAGAVETLPIPRGRLIGGSGAVNGASFARSVPEDFDDWGSRLWSFDAVLPAFKRMETDWDFGGDEHGSDGPIAVGRHRPDQWLPFQAAFHEAALEAGFAAKPDLNAAAGSGVGALPRNDVAGIRMCSALAHLAQARGRSNLQVRSETLALRVVVEAGRAMGVEIAARSGTETVGGDEIVLCAGGIESPHLLMLSGLGPARDLKRLGVPVVEDLPGVGQSLSDHAIASVDYRPGPGHEPLTHEPRIQLALIATAPGSEYRNDLRLQPTSWLSALPANPDDMPDRLAIVTIFSRPTSRGRLRFSSADPRTPPELHFNYFDTEDDRRRMTGGVRIALDLAGSGMFKGILGERVSPVEEEQADDDALEAWVTANSRTAYHASGTAKMGATDDATAVVDELLRVRGVEGLRVADLSVAPVVSRGSTHPTAVMIGERAAELMR